jgi:SAM-dependent methyltransferase
LKVGTVTSKLNGLIALLRSLEKIPQDQDLVSGMLQALDIRYALSQKIAREPGLEEIIKQLVGRIYHAYGSFIAVAGQRILDIACGSSTSTAPSFVFVNTPFGESRIPIPAMQGYTAQFEPWFCRILLELGAHPVGIDLGNLDSETFEHYHVDLGKLGALSFLASASFDAVHDSRLFGSPEFTAQFPGQEDRLKIAAEIWSQEKRVLKPKGAIIHSDAANLVR